MKQCDWLKQLNHVAVQSSIVFIEQKQDDYKFKRQIDEQMTLEVYFQQLSKKPYLARSRCQIMIFELRTGFLSVKYYAVMNRGSKQ